MYLLKWFLKRLTKIYNGILGRINFKWTPVIVNFFWLLKKVSFSLLTTTLYVCTLVLLRKNVVCKHIYEYQRIYIFFGCFHKYTTSNRLSHHCLQYIYRPFKLHCLHKEQQMKAMPSWSSALAFAAQWWYIAVLFTKMYFDTDINPIFGHFKRSIPLPSLMLSISNFNTFIYLELKIWTGAVPPIKKFNWILPPFLFWVHRNETSMY